MSLPTISIIATTVIAILGLLLSERRHREQIANERMARKQELDRELERSEKHREDMPLLQFDMEVGLIHQKHNMNLVEFHVILDNRGNVKQDIKSIKLRVRSINKDDKLNLWKDRDFRVEFPNKIFEAEIIPKGYRFIFVEPNVRQVLNYATLLDSSVEIVSARAEFSYGKARKGSRGSKHSVEKIFAIGSEPQQKHS